MDNRHQRKQDNLHETGEHLVSGNLPGWFAGAYLILFGASRLPRQMHHIHPPDSSHCVPKYTNFFFFSLSLISFRYSRLVEVRTGPLPIKTGMNGTASVGYVALTFPTVARRDGDGKHQWRHAML